MNDPDWAKILQFIHENNGSYSKAAYVDDSLNMNKEEIQEAIEKNRKAVLEGLLADLELDTETSAEVEEVISHLKSTHLVTRSSLIDSARIELTPKGFDVAHEREQNSRQNRINNSLVFFTFVLVLAEIVGSVPLDRSWKIGMSLVILVGMLYVVLQTDILDR